VRTRPPLVREFSAGGLVYGRRDGDWAVVLAARRRPERGELVWTIPKGHVEPGERTIDAAVREVLEETGLVAAVEEPLGDITYWFARGTDRVLKRVRFWLMRHRGGRFADRDAEMDAVRWFTLGAAEAQAAYPNEQVLVARARALLEGRT
jgi:8-oxo-dGTP pyrophosphatase MutT (NUDIX family)